MKPNGRWFNAAATERYVPRGKIEWIKGTLGHAGSINGKNVATILVYPSAFKLLKVKGWMWKVTPDMGVARFNIIPGDKIKEVSCKGFATVLAAKKEAAAILSTIRGEM